MCFWHFCISKNTKTQEFPTFTVRQGVIVGVYPGATSVQIEEQLAKPLEQFLFTYKEVRREKTYTMSRDGIVYAMVELEESVTNKDEVWSKIKHGLTTFKATLPAGVLAVIANDDFRRHFSLAYLYGIRHALIPRIGKPVGRLGESVAADQIHFQSAALRDSERTDKHICRQ